MVLLLDKAGIVERTPGPWRRLLVRLRAAHLDRALADGAAPESRVDIAVHAERLVRPAARYRVAEALARLLADADNPPAHSGFQVPVDWAKVRAVRDDIGRLTDLLTGPGPVAANGMAQLRVLLSDGTGPLLGPGSPEGLRRRLQEAAAALVG